MFSILEWYRELSTILGVMSEIVHVLLVVFKECYAEESSNIRENRKILNIFGVLYSKLGCKGLFVRVMYKDVFI